MNELDLGYLYSAMQEAHRAGLFYPVLKQVAGGYIVQQTWMDPVFAYCGAGT
jgi:hypothetical protein